MPLGRQEGVHHHQDLEDTSWTEPHPKASPAKLVVTTSGLSGLRTRCGKVTGSKPQCPHSVPVRPEVNRAGISGQFVVRPTIVFIETFFLT